MSIQQLIDDEAIIFEGYTPDQQAKLIEALEALYQPLPDGNPSQAMMFLDSFRDELGGIKFQYEEGLAQSIRNSNDVVLDVDLTWAHVDQLGNVVETPLERVVLHELIHAVLGLDDTTDDLSGAALNPDHAGDTVTRTNEMLRELGYGDRVSYAGQDEQYVAGSFLNIGDELTAGIEIDNVVVTFPGFEDEAGATATGLNPNTEINTERVRDLVIDAENVANEIRTGIGNDWIYAQGGDDQIFGSAGSNYVNGGEGNDTIYFGEQIATAGSAQQGISATISSESTTVVNAYGGTDTLISVENIFGTALNDTFTLNGTLGQIDVLYNNLSAEVANGENSETATDTLILNLGEGVSANLEAGVLSQGAFQIGIVGFENVVGATSSGGGSGDQSGGDEITGSSGDNNIEGRDGLDDIDGGAGDDTLRGNAGDDTLDGGAGVDFIEGGSGNDTIDAGAQGGTVLGGSGNDELTTGADGAVLLGGSGDDTLDARGTTNPNATVSLNGGSGNDTLYGNGNSTLTGGSGVDVFHIQAGDIITDAEAHDEIWFEGVRITIDPNDPGASDPYAGDYLWGVENFYDLATIAGTPSSPNYDRPVEDFEIAFAFELMPLPAEFDYTTQSVTYRLHVYVAPTDDDFYIGAGGFTAFNLQQADFVIENFHRGDFGIDMEITSVENTVTFNNMLFLGSVHDPRLQFDGNGTDPTVDFLESPGNLWEFGTPSEISAEQLALETLFETVTEAVEDISYLAQGSPGGSTSTPTEADDIIAVENAVSVSGGGGNDIIVGSNQSNNISGDGGNDTLVGNLGSDTIIGGAGNDILIGGGSLNIIGETEFEYEAPPAPPPTGGGPGEFPDPGDEELPPPGDDTGGGEGPPGEGGGDHDTPPEDDGETPPEEGGGNPPEEPVGDDDIISGGLGDDWAFGGGGDDLISGDEGNDRLDGGTGNDVLNGGTGEDQLLGDAGNDTLNGDDGIDDLSGGTGHDTLNGGEDADTLNGDAGNDILNGDDGNDLLSGGQGDDTLNGGTGDDVLNGGAGDDELIGGEGNDTLNAGGGNNVLEGGQGDDILNGSFYADTYVYSLGDSNDTITDYGDGNVTDRLVLAGYSQADVTFVQNHDDLIVQLSDGATITVTNHFVNSLWDINEFEFGDGSILDADDITISVPVPAVEASGTSLNTADGSQTVASFVAGEDVLVLNGVPLDPNALPAGYTASEVNGSTVVQSDDGSTFTLTNVALADWQAAGANQTIGDALDNAITGSSTGGLIAAGAGNDTIIAGSGDDTIVYTSGDDVIQGNKKNFGHDTLDLSQYEADEVTFTVSNTHDVLITTPDGVIELDYQGRYAIGHARTNIEEIIFSDGILDGAGIMARALGDQATDGDDTINGTLQADTLGGGAGNDILIGSQGDDTFVFTSGNDVIAGHGGTAETNYGFDTLDLSQYNLADVTFSEGGDYDIIITTADGTIELDYQARYASGHARTNIEEIVFADGVLDEQGILDRAANDLLI